MLGGIDSGLHERLEAVAVRTRAALVRTNTILVSVAGPGDPQRRPAFEGRIADTALRDRLAIAEAAARDTRHWLLDEPRHSPEALRDIQASVRAIEKALDAIRDDQRNP